MRRRIVSLLVAPLCVIGLAAASGCGVAANDTAATVGSSTVSTSSVNVLASDAAFVQAAFTGLTPPANDSVLPGDLARRALVFEIQRVALQDELARFGLNVDPQEAAQLRAQIRQQVPGLRAATLTKVVLAQSALSTLEARLGALDPKKDADLRLLYDGSPARWDQVCLVAVRVPADRATLRKAQRALDGGTKLSDLPKKVKTAALAADPKQACVARLQLPDELRTDVETARVGKVRGPVVVSGPQSDVAFFYRVESTKRFTFGQARSQLRALATDLVAQHQQQAAVAYWLQNHLVGGVVINPQYGRALVASSQGFDIVPPQAPLGTLATAATVPSAQQGSGQQGSGQQGSGQQGSAQQSTP